MVSLSLLNMRYQENASAGETSPESIRTPTGVFLCLDENGLGLSVCRFTQRLPTQHGSGDSELNKEWVRESLRKIDLDKPPKFEEKMEINEETDEVDTTLSLSLPGAKRKDDLCSKKLVQTSPSLALKGPNRAENMPQANNNQPRMICMGCIRCNIHFTIIPNDDPKCPKCGKQSFLLDPQISPRGNKRARNK